MEGEEGGETERRVKTDGEGGGFVGFEAVGGEGLMEGEKWEVDEGWGFDRVCEWANQGGWVR